MDWKPKRQCILKNKYSDQPTIHHHVKKYHRSTILTELQVWKCAFRILLCDQPVMCNLSSGNSRKATIVIHDWSEFAQEQIPIPNLGIEEKNEVSTTFLDEIQRNNNFFLIATTGDNNECNIYHSKYMNIYDRLCNGSHFSRWLGILVWVYNKLKHFQPTTLALTWLPYSKHGMRSAGSRMANASVSVTIRWTTLFAAVSRGDG